VEYEASEDSAVLSFSAKFPSCPMAADALEIRYRCVEDCDDDTEERVVMTKCAWLSECVAGERAVGGATAHAFDRGVLGAAAVLGEPRVPSARVSV